MTSQVRAVNPTQPRGRRAAAGETAKAKETGRNPRTCAAAAEATQEERETERPAGDGATAALTPPGRGLRGIREAETPQLKGRDCHFELKKPNCRLPVRVNPRA